MIVRNEQPFLDGCLSSLRGIVDEIVIVDTGSTDASIDIATAHGARILHHPWHDDFAAARNIGLAAATSEWILYIDADERVVRTTREDLRAGLDTPGAFAARPFFRIASNRTFCREYRLFRNDPRLRFKGAMHETIIPDLERLEREVGALTVESPATLVHLGYDGDMTAKWRRNLPLLRASVLRDPDRMYYWSDLANTLSGLGEIGEALAVVEEALARPAPPEGGGNAIRSLLRATHARLLLRLGRDALPTIEQGLALSPSNWSLIFLRAQALIEAGKAAEALPDLDALVAIDSATFCDDTLGYDIRIFGCYAYDLMGVAKLRLGDRPGAAEAFAHAAAAPDVLEYRVKAQALAVRPASAGPAASRS
jgi:tetratricopeptide (TPR) repeat protein